MPLERLFKVAESTLLLTLTPSVLNTSDFMFLLFVFISSTSFITPSSSRTLEAAYDAVLSMVK